MDNQVNKRKNPLLRLLVKGGFILVAVLLFSGIRSCVDEMGMDEKIDQISGRWQVQRSSFVSWNSILEDLNYLETELSVLDNALPFYAKYVGFIEEVEFKTDRTYSFRLSKDKTKDLVKEKLDSFFQVLYENKDQLSSLYNLDFSSATKSDLENFYAILCYSYDSYEMMIDDVSSIIVESLDYATETGTYKISGKKIVCKEAEQSKEESIPYKLKDEILCLTFDQTIGDPMEYEFKRVN